MNSAEIKTNPSNVTHALTNTPKNLLYSLLTNDSVILLIIIIIVIYNLPYYMIYTFEWSIQNSTEKCCELGLNKDTILIEFTDLT